MQQERQSAEAVRNVDVVRAPSFIADQALPRLGDEVGAVIRDVYLHRVYWLLPAGSAGAWMPLRHVETYGPGASVEVPAADCTKGVRRFWQVPPGRGRLLTDPELLHDVLRPLVLRAYGPIEPGW
ncbi:hypothetical protein [Streptomyces lycii]|uniref:Uncharacterized protein n=1 Tax=Streptomyces lycii TaxID=2654337 RepID=A0ABQ7FEA3_9ACTN|nr:hypothetical protein [Streptomyces lycii]KAF4405593.1 hypothetical protein GCU69_29450 [Streptomyces lycii]